MNDTIRPASYDGPEKAIKWLFDAVAALINGGAGQTHYPVLFVDSGGYISADYGPEAENGDG